MSSLGPTRLSGCNIEHPPSHIHTFIQQFPNMLRICFFVLQHLLRDATDVDRCLSSLTMPNIVSLPMTNCHRILHQGGNGMRYVRRKGNETAIHQTSSGAPNDMKSNSTVIPFNLPPLLPPCSLLSSQRSPGPLTPHPLEI